MHVDSPAAAGDFVRKIPAGEDILLGQHVISENPPGLPHAELFGGRGNIGVFKARHMFLQELQNPERLPGPLPPDAHLIGGIQGIAVRNVGHVDDPVEQSVAFRHVLDHHVVNRDLLREAPPDRAHLGHGLRHLRRLHSADLKRQRGGLHSAVGLPAHFKRASGHRRQIAVAGGVHENPGFQRPHSGLGGHHRIPQRLPLAHGVDKPGVQVKVNAVLFEQFQQNPVELLRVEHQIAVPLVDSADGDGAFPQPVHESRGDALFAAAVAGNHPQQPGDGHAARLPEIFNHPDLQPLAGRVHRRRNAGHSRPAHQKVIFGPHF